MNFLFLSHMTNVFLFVFFMCLVWHCVSIPTLYRYYIGILLVNIDEPHTKRPKQPILQKVTLSESKETEYRSPPLFLFFYTFFFFISCFIPVWEVQRCLQTGISPVAAKRTLKVLCCSSCMVSGRLAWLSLIDRAVSGATFTLPSTNLLY